MSDLVKCQICQAEMKELHSHLFRKHKMTVTNYKQLYPGHPTRSKRLLEINSKNFSGLKNPGYQHGGRLSPFSDKYIYGNIAKITNTKAEASRKKNASHSTRIDYWLKKTNGDIEKAMLLLTERQTTFSLEKCIARYGEEAGLKRWHARQEKWLKNYKKQNFSQISQKLFNRIMEIYQSTQVYYATRLREDMKEYINKEYRLVLNSGKTILPDFIDLEKKKIIEFDGTYWHGQQISNPQREKKREQDILQSGYQLLRIREEDYLRNPNNVLQECLNFLTK